MAYLHDSQMTVMTLDQWMACRSGVKSFPEKGVIISFDDGFKSFHGRALPVLKRYSLPAVLFVLSDLVGKTNEWMQCRGFPRRDLLSWRDLELAAEAGVTLGCHTRTHPRLPEIADSPRLLLDEVGGARRKLQRQLGTSVDYFAYPYGLFDNRVKDVVSDAGFRAACSVRAGFSRPETDLMALPRIDVYGGDSLWQFKQKIRFGRNDARLLFPVRYYAGRVVNRFRMEG